MRSLGWSEGVRGSEVVCGSEAASKSYSEERTVDTDFAGGRLVKKGAWSEVDGVLLPVPGRELGL